MKSARRKSVVVGIGWIVALLVCGSWSGLAEASSPDRKPTVTLINGAGAQHDSVAETLRGILSSQDDLEVVSAATLLSSGESHGVGRETLRKSSHRASNVDSIRATMREAGAEIVLVIDVFAGKVQVVAIGPKGRERSDVRRPLTRGRLSKKRAASLLKESFADVVPVWESWTKKRSSGQETETFSSESSPSADRPAGDAPAESSGSEESASAASTPETDDGAAGTDAGADRALQPGVEARLGAVAGRRKLNVTTPQSSNYGIQQANPFVGGTLELNSVLGRFANQSAGFGLELFGTYAPFQIALQEPGAGGGNAAEYSSSISQVGIDLVYLNQLSKRFRLRVGTGFEALSLRVEKNAEYTGNRYAQFRFTGGVVYRLSQMIRARVGGGLAPIVRSDMSGGAFGESAFAPAVLGDARLEMRLFGSASLALDYRLYYYDLVFRSPDVIQTQAKVSDLYNMLSLKASYRF